MIIKEYTDVESAPYEYDEVKAQQQAWRECINELRR